MSVLEAATFAWRLTVEGAEAVMKAFSDIGGAANTNMKGAAGATQPANAALLALTGQLGGVAKGVEGLQSLRNQLIAIAGAGGVGLLIESSLNAAANVKKMAAEAGMATTPFQELVFALRQFHVEQDTASTAMTKFGEETAQFVAHNAGPAKKAYETLFGANAQSIAQQGLTNIDQFFMQVLNKVGQLKNESQKVELLKELFGKSAGPELIEAADAGLQAIQAEREEAERLGVVMDENMIDKAADAKVNIENLTETFHTKLAIAINENADAIEKFAQIGIDSIPLVSKAFESLYDIVKNMRDEIAFISVDLQNAFTIGSNVIDMMSPNGANGRHNGPVTLGGLLEGTPNPFDAFGANNGSGQESSDLLSSTGLGNHRKTQPPPDLGDDKVTQQNQKEQESYEKLTYSLQEQIDAMGSSEKEMFINTEERKLGMNATDEQKDAIDKLAGTLFDEKQAWETLKSASNSTGQTISQALDNATIKGQNFHTVLQSLIQSLEQIAYKAMIGDPMSKAISGAMQNMLGTGGNNGVTWDTPSFGGGRASGGPIDPGKWYIAGEYGPEPIWGGGAGAFATGYGAGGSAPTQSGPTFNVDMRGADTAAVSQLRSFVQQVNGSIETRALNIYQQAQLRSLQFGA